MKLNDILAIPKWNDMAQAYSTVVVLVTNLVSYSQFFDYVTPLPFAVLI